MFVVLGLCSLFSVCSFHCLWWWLFCLFVWWCLVLNVCFGFGFCLVFLFGFGFFGGKFCLGLVGFVLFCIVGFVVFAYFMFSVWFCLVGLCLVVWFCVCFLIFCFFGVGWFLFLFCGVML